MDESQLRNIVQDCISPLAEAVNNLASRLPPVRVLKSSPVSPLSQRPLSSGISRSTKVSIPEPPSDAWMETPMSPSENKPSDEITPREGATQQSRISESVANKTMSENKQVPGSLDGNTGVTKTPFKRQRAARMTTGGRRTGPLLTKAYMTQEKRLEKSREACRKKLVRLGLADLNIEEGIREMLQKDDFPVNAFTSPLQMIQESMRIQRRTRNAHRNMHDVEFERKYAQHTGCPLCRRFATDQAVGKKAANDIYEAIVGCCTHLPLGALKILPASSSVKRNEETKTDGAENA